MKFSSLFLTGLKNFIKDKKNIINIFVFGLIFALVMLCFSFRKSLNNYWNDSVKKLVDYRTYVARYDSSRYNLSDAIDRIKTHNHIVGAFDRSSFLISMKVQDNTITLEDNNSIMLIGTIPNPVNIVIGNDLSSVSNDYNPIICAKQFYPFLESYQEDYVVSKAIDISEKINKELKLSFIVNDEIEKFKIVGLYDAKENHIEGNICYTNPEIVSSLNKKYQPEVFDVDRPELDYLYVVIDDISNEKTVLDEIRNDGFDLIIPTLQLNKDMGNNVISIIFIVSSIIVILSTTVILYFSKNKFKRREKDFIAMKSFGYSDFEIACIYVFELACEIIIAFLCSFLIFYMITSILSSIYLSNKIVFYDLKISLDYLSIAINMILSMFVFIASILYFKYKIKMNK